MSSSEQAAAFHLFLTYHNREYNNVGANRSKGAGVTHVDVETQHRVVVLMQGGSVFETASEANHLYWAPCPVHKMR